MEGGKSLKGKNLPMHSGATLYRKNFPPLEVIFFPLKEMDNGKQLLTKFVLPPVSIGSALKGKILLPEESITSF